MGRLPKKKEFPQGKILKPKKKKQHYRDTFLFGREKERGESKHIRTAPDTPQGKSSTGQGKMPNRKRSKKSKKPA